MDKKELKNIADKIYNGNASEEDIERYNFHLNNFLLREKEEEIEDEEALKSKLFSSIQSQLNVPDNEFKWNMITKIAATLIIAISSFFVYNNISLNNQKEKLSLINNVSPGSSKATLTLSNGKTIILDELKNGTTIKEENAVITITENGKLVYDLSQNSSSSKEIHQISTPRGGKFNIILPDKSIVYLNSESSISFPTSFSAKERNIKLTGEAYFEISTDKVRPFKIAVEDVNIQVLGTQFNVNAYPNNALIQTSLFEGSVKINYAKVSKTLKPYEQATVISGEHNIAIEKFEDDNALAWKNDVFVFDNESLEEIMKKISRWYDVDVFYEGDVKNNYYGGRYSMKNNLSDLLKSIELTGSIRFKIEGRRVTVMR